MVLLGLNYKTAAPPPCPPGSGRTSRYAWGTTDYHDIIREKLKLLSREMKQRQPGVRTRGIVDTAPLLERDFAQLAGLGWFGKNTLLLNKQMGSYFFLAAMLTDAELKPDRPHETAHCGTCTRCLEICPTEAFVEPYVLDARKCISYLTIELRGAIPRELRHGMGEWLFGCDLCQEVCPWNRKAPESHEVTFQPRADLASADLGELFDLDERTFEERFGTTPLARPGRAGILRNAAIVLGNQRRAEGVPALIKGLQDLDPVVRGACAWGLGEIRNEAARSALSEWLLVEEEIEVREEIELALQK
ncbi:MAG: tRNA epoxyqueuosine(34) reductase QueG [Planctomycetales bacterium]